MGCVLRDYFDSYELLGFGDQVPEGYELADRRHDAKSFLDRFWGDYFAMSSLRSFLGRQGSCDLSRMDDADVLRQVAYCLESGQAKLAVRKPERETYLWVPPPLEIPVPAPPAEIAPYHDVYAIDLTHLYHDDDPVQEAGYELELEDGEKVKGRLSKKGKASIKNLASPPKRVRYGEDQREFQRVDQRKNADYKPPPKALEAIEKVTSIKPYRPNPYYVLHEDAPGWVQDYDFTEGDSVGVDPGAADVVEIEVEGKPKVTEVSYKVPDQVEAGPWFRSYDDEKQELAGDVGDWIWGTLQGSFNEQASTSQIVADAMISMIPIVGDVAAGRDLVAILVRLSEHPEKREDILEWVHLVLVAFSLVPVLGGAVKGVGKVLLKMAKGAGKSAEAAKLLLEALAVLRRLSIGKAETFVRTLKLDQYAAKILGGFRWIMQGLLEAFKKVLELMGKLVAGPVVKRLKELQLFLVNVAIEGERMIPEAMKEFGRRLKVIQECVYDGEYFGIAAAAAGRTASKLTRTAEAKLLAVVGDDGKPALKWVGKDLPYPQDMEAVFKKVEGFPNLLSGDHVSVSKLGATTYKTISTFSGAIPPVHIPEGTELFRIVGPKSRDAGLCWTYKLPKSGKEWRENWAVLDSWNENGEYVKIVAPKGGLWGWEGATASQFEQNSTSPAFGQFLPGGGTQVVIDFKFPANRLGEAFISNRMPTNWGKTTGRGVPDNWHPGQLRYLGEYELEPKLTEKAASAAPATKNATELMAKDSPGEEMRQ